MNRFLSLLLIGMLGLSACYEEDYPNETFIIIGASFGECVGNCAQLYLIADGEVFPDDGIDYAGAVGTVYARNLFASSSLKNVDAQLLDSLITQLPERLPFANTRDFGCPDCGDWGALPLVIGNAYPQAGSYLLDNSTDNMSADMQAYGELMKRALAAWR